MKTPILISVPHGGWKVPEEIKSIWALNRKDAFHDGDPYTPQIYDFRDKAESQIISEYYRASIDLNREPDNTAPKNPDGLIKSHTCYNVQVYKDGIIPDKKLTEILKAKYYYPYFEFLEKTIKNGKIKMGVDCHSMAEVTPPIGGDDAGKARSLICLGNLGDINGKKCLPHNRLSASTDLINFCKDEFIIAFRNEDVEIEVPAICTTNVPYEGGYFEGGYITRKMSHEKIPFFQIEMSRALYLSKKYFNEKTLEIDSKRLKYLNKKIWKVLENTVKNL
ncbi:MAG: hypothetical protein B6I24_11180 [Bacteroidetes bacterium 4572_128]|nr:MAG: hypothetical protein B6I24_11180 [Bacteroidetes bacterium 4572_128]